jgi:hypothetical protein
MRGLGLKLFYKRDLNHFQKLGMTMSGTRSAAEAVEGAALALKSVDDVESGDGLSLGVLGVGDGVTDDVLEEAAEDGAGLLVDVGADSLDTTAARKSADSGLGNAEDGLLEGLLGSEALGTGLAALAFAADLCSACHLILVLITAGRPRFIKPLRVWTDTARSDLIG